MRLPPKVTTTPKRTSNKLLTPVVLSFAEFGFLPLEKRKCRQRGDSEMASSRSFIIFADLMDVPCSCKVSEFADAVVAMLDADSWHEALPRS